MRARHQLRGRIDVDSRTGANDDSALWMEFGWMMNDGMQDWRHEGTFWRWCVCRATGVNTLGVAQSSPGFGKGCVEGEEEMIAVGRWRSW